MPNFRDLTAGCIVTRMLAGTIPQKMVVRLVDDDYIYCAAEGFGEFDEKTGEWTGWKFDRDTGVEEDEELGWGKKFGLTGSFLVREADGC